MHRSGRNKRGLHVVVTGSGSGIGRAIALRLAREGARIGLLGRREGPLAETAARALDAGASGAWVRSLDVRDRAATNAAFRAAAEEHGPFFGLVANAGVGGPNEPGADDRFDELVATNLTGTYNCVRAALPHLAAGEHAGHLVLMSSILARIGVPGYTGYCASKAALLGLTRSLAMELAPGGVQVNAVCPGWVETDMAVEGLQGMAAAMDCSLDEARAIALREVPLGRMSQPEDVAGLVSWLLSPDARGVTGQALDMNNGAFMS